MKQSSRISVFAGIFFALGLSVGTVRAEEVYLVRGGFNVFSTGMNQMTKKLRQKGVRASSHGIMSWKRIAKDIVDRSKTNSVSYPIIFLGHSLGANAGADFANYLGEHGIPVELVIGFDATGNRAFRKGAKKAINYRMPSGGRYLEGEGFQGSIQEVDVSGLGANHFNVEKVKEVQELAMTAVLAHLRRR